MQYLNIYVQFLSALTHIFCNTIGSLFQFICLWYVTYSIILSRLWFWGYLYVCFIVLDLLNTAQCAIYGTGFIESAKATWNLFESKGIMALINDDLTGGALICGSVLAYVISGLIAFGILRLWGDLHNELELDIGIACLVGLLGFVLCFQILYVVRSSS